MKRTFPCLIVLLALTASLFAENSLCPPGVPRKVEPLFDHPLRDTAICRGPDPADGGTGATWYLTGTVGTKIDKASDKDTCHSSPRIESGDQAPDTRHPTHDFNNNDGIWLWKSTDLENWEPLGQVWSIGKDPDRLGNAQFGSESVWQLYWRVDPKTGEKVRGMTAPEIHYIKDNFCITYSMNGFGSGLLVSETGQPEGPYKDMGKMARFGGDASMFEDSDGSVYWVWGNGWIAKMKDDLTGLAEPARPLETTPEIEGGTWPLRIGTGGAFIFKADVPGWKEGPYHLVGYEHIPRMGPVPCADTFIASSKSVYGPYNKRHLMAPHGGQVTVFQGPDDTYYSTFSGSDEWAAFRDKPGILPLEPHATKFGAPYWWCGAFIKPWYPVTEGGAWGDINPFVSPANHRDISVLNAPDGYYYMTCTDMNLNRKINFPSPREKLGVEVWRSKDMKEWESIGIVWKCDDSPETKAGLDKTLELERWGVLLYDIELHYLKDTYWIVGSMQTGRKWFEKDGCLILVLRSTSGKVEGPYEFMWQDEHDANLWTPSILEDDDGTFYIVGGGVGNTVGKLKDDLTGLDGPYWKIFPNGMHKIGEGGHLLKIGGKYIHTSAVWHGADPYDKGMARNGRMFSTYDLMYFTADDLKGPWSETRCAAPKCGNTRPFQDKNGQWWAPFFGNHYMGPWTCMASAYPIQVRIEEDDVFLEALK